MVETQITVTHTEPVAKSSLIVVSNRLPFVLKRNAKTGELERSARYVRVSNVSEKKILSRFLDIVRFNSFARKVA